MKDFKLIKRIENMVKPLDIATLQLIAPMANYIPKRFQNQVIENTAGDNPYMAFIVEPYATFLFYEIIDLEWAERLIPDGFELVKTKIFEDDTPKYYAIFGSFKVSTSAFAGVRLETNIIARNKTNNLIIWVIVDYDTNTVSHDKSKGIVSSTTEQAIFTTDFRGNIIVDIDNPKRDRSLIFDVDTKNSKLQKLDRDLWQEGNLSVGYGREISENTKSAFSLKFDTREVETAFEIPLENINIEKNTWFDGLFDKTVKHAVYFPYAQHYLSDAPGFYSKIESVEDMVESVKNLDIDSIPDYSAKTHRKMIKTGLILNTLFIFTLITLLILK